MSAYRTDWLKVGWWAALAEADLLVWAFVLHMLGAF